MGRLVDGIRFLVGATLVTAGVILAVPVAMKARQALWPQTQPVGGGVTTVAAAPQVPDVVVVPDAVAATSPVVQPGWSPAPAVTAVPYQPPVPPQPLPPVPGSLTAATPPLGHSYRTTFDAPPPPLLDAHAPPPAHAAWTMPVAPQATAVVPNPATPATYRVEDGDDLTGIATRFYGTPAAAAAIWSANRDLIADPNLLPIGAELRLPPLAAGNAAGNGIEPAGLPVPGLGTVAPPPAAPAVAQASWLGGAAPPAAAAAVVVPAAAPPRPSTVRVAPGDSLASIAVRFYGDAAAARRIWEANRDRLRSPDLLVAGMELRLP